MDTTLKKQESVGSILLSSSWVLCPWGQWQSHRNRSWQALSSPPNLKGFPSSIRPSAWVESIPHQLNQGARIQCCLTVFAEEKVDLQKKRLNRIRNSSSRPICGSKELHEGRVGMENVSMGNKYVNMKAV